LLSAYDFSGIATLMDVGGGLGELLSAILKKNPSMRGIVFDLPHCADGARKNLADAGLADRCEFIGGSFFEAVPAGADAIMMKAIIQDWNDERCLRILQNCHRALKPGARLMVLDRIVPKRLGVHV
jgi:ubiquinone/menaquinone biosynthesis C-methylase UbiE